MSDVKETNLTDIPVPQNRPLNEIELALLQQQMRHGQIFANACSELGAKLGITNSAVRFGVIMYGEALMKEDPAMWQEIRRLVKVVRELEEKEKANAKETEANKGEKKDDARSTAPAASEKITEPQADNRKSGDSNSVRTTKKSGKHASGNSKTRK